MYRASRVCSVYGVLGSCTSAPTCGMLFLWGTLGVLLGGVWVLILFFPKP